ncbi:hypothetical protein [Shewanella surugensis]|uniref:Uncharacterized protein n=1 Tax=Shewanella surugensis TaxID=212020 RepID=A0ABT0LI90_9GAMM|nr:hypothetical protein [Shewanella surugensis]MCL1127413.1 hypothetical protein [Shewanella surugensis]
MSGGKFANGARMGAMQYLMNQAGKSLKELGRETLWDRVSKNYSSEFLSDFKKSNPYEYSLFKKYALSVDANLWNNSSSGLEMEINALSKFSTFASGEANSYFVNEVKNQAIGSIHGTYTGKIRDAALSAIGAWPIVGKLVGDYQMASGAFNYGSNITEVMNIQMNGSQVINGGFINEVYGQN